VVERLPSKCKANNCPEAKYLGMNPPAVQKLVSGHACVHVCMCACIDGLSIHIHSSTYSPSVQSPPPVHPQPQPFLQRHLLLLSFQLMDTQVCSSCPKPSHPPLPLPYTLVFFGSRLGLLLASLTPTLLCSEVTESLFYLSSRCICVLRHPQRLWNPQKNKTQ